MTQDLFGADSAQGSASSLAPHLKAWSPDTWPVHDDWQPTLTTFWRSSEGESLSAFIKERLANGAVVYPEHPLWALLLTPLASVRVVILGQDPYHGPYQAQGLSFSVAPGVKVPPSLRNIFKELQRDVGLLPPQSGSLESWAKRGVLLLNTCLTVEQGRPASHAKRGWDCLTDALLTLVARTAPACVYMLWGVHAQAKAPMIELQTRRNISNVVEAGRVQREALVLLANHPSPLSALRPPLPFVGCGHFSTATHWLSQRGLEISWAL
ncbi:uracil-DNA glycosylase [Limnohabitans sp. B9-3]|uniref:uracil-DNA glycosylase n=1 Tax=Limnohabitans sp. B9-3 TaxID=1100707 RepID=UPI000C1F032B|nr:uracil-DNA glycosylase [Limnohabitans sp. B9-3]PIT71740.1 uracil-DNA glycosylase [Limnohabitans sp. B9-3]